MRKLAPFFNRTHQQIALRLQAIRFRKILENLREIHDLFQNGAEKIQGEYILDHYYVVTLVHQVLEKIGMIVFDANILVSKDNSVLYRIFDEHRKIVRDHFTKKDSPAYDNNLAGYKESLLEEPEYRLLANALSWIDGTVDSNRKSVMDFLKYVLEYVISDIDDNWKSQYSSLYSLRLKSSELEDLLAIIDGRGEATNAKAKLISSHELNCRPLGMMLMDVDHKAISASSRAGPKWLAVVDDDHLSMRSSNREGGIRIESTMSGYLEDNFVFVYLRKPTKPHLFIPEDFIIENTENGTLCWSYNVAMDRMENDLMELGSYLFRSAPGPTEL